jgi:hypothetical protein
MFKRIAAVVLLGLAVTALLTSSSQTLFAQSAKPDFTVGKKGEVHFNIAVKAGATLLKPGMYQIQHVVDGQDHAIAFTPVTMPAGYRHGGTHVAKEPAVRVTCRIEPLGQTVRKTTITLRTNAAGEKEIAEVRVAGESLKHVF